MTPNASSALVVGSDSVIGSALIDALRAAGWEVTTTSRRHHGSAIHLDLAAEDGERTPLPEAAVAFFCAAMTRFADCDSDPDLARRVNVTVPVALATRLVSSGGHVILLSTSAVFDGHQPRVPADRAVAPATVYGRLKADAETGFLSLGSSAAVLRLTRVLHPRLPLFRGWIEALAAGRKVTAFSDLVLAPIPLRLVVDALARMATERQTGVLQASASRDISYLDAARHLAGRVGLGADRVVADHAADHGIPVEQRPPYSSLDTTLLDALLGAEAPDPFAAIDAVFPQAILR